MFARFEKVEWVAETIWFLGCEINNGHWNHASFVKKKLAELGDFCNMNDLELIIGVIFYTHRCVKDVEMILGPLHEGLQTIKSVEASEDWICALNN